jgi:hypothetical protein
MISIDAASQNPMDLKQKSLFISKLALSSEII